MPRTITRHDPRGASLVPFTSACAVTISSDSSAWIDIMALGLIHGIVPPQNPGVFLAGVPPERALAHPESGWQLHPSGISPNSDSTNSLGNSLAISGSMPAGWRPSALA